MKRLQFNLRPMVKIKLGKLKYRPEPWEPNKTFLGTGKPSDAKILSNDVESFNKAVICVSGKLYLVDKPRKYEDKLTMYQAAEINRNIKQYGGHPEDVGR